MYKALTLEWFLACCSDIISLHISVKSEQVYYIIMIIMIIIIIIIIISSSSSSSSSSSINWCWYWFLSINNSLERFWSSLAFHEICCQLSKPVN